MQNDINNPNQLSPEQKKENRTLLGALGFIVLAVAVLAIVGFLFLNKPADILEGQAEATSVRVSGKLPGRVVEFYVQEGDLVHKGDTLVHIHSSLAEAKLEQAQGMETAARAMDRKVDAGTRSQIIQSAYEMWQQANAAVTITKKTYDRMQNLYSEGVMSEQKRDEAKAAYDAAVAAAKAAESQYSLAKSGAQSEDKTSAAAMVTVAKGGVSEVEALLEDQYLTAPCDGQIDVIFPHVGELVALGAPIMNVLKLQDKYITFNVREHYLKDFRMGQDVTVTIPALDNKELKARIYYIRDLGSYATWHATKTTGDWDAKTFEVKMRPAEDLPDLRPGMTVIIRE
ncbi:MAG TPA: hemolysin secretion protein D [Porphyromonadaceae bacterium]|jgi:HlyD family secretion protein|nr:HlyD family efflux transporter periplasmic adaptor subunit [Muribaculaceae bacterium Isolate-013 (NCI)]HAP28588.1 hemolysin secretion protein D [Porphyromonadaceae bacterium]